MLSTTLVLEGMSLPIASLINRRLADAPELPLWWALAVPPPFDTILLCVMATMLIASLEGLARRTKSRGHRMVGSGLHFLTGVGSFLLPTAMVLCPRSAFAWDDTGLLGLVMDRASGSAILVIIATAYGSGWAIFWRGHWGLPEFVPPPLPVRELVCRPEDAPPDAEVAPALHCFAMPPAAPLPQVATQPGTAAVAFVVISALSISGCADLSPVLREDFGTTSSPGVFTLSLRVKGAAVANRGAYAVPSAARHSGEVGCPLVADPPTAQETSVLKKPEGDGEPKTEEETAISTLLRCPQAAPVPGVRSGEEDGHAR